MSSATRPSTREVVKALKALSIEKTRNLVFHLGVPPTALDDIEQEYSGDTRKQKFVEKWLDIDTDASWEKLVYGLREIDMTVLAAGVESEYERTEALPSASKVAVSQPVQTASLPVVALTPASLTPANSNRLPAANEARVAEVRANIGLFKELFTDLTVDVELELFQSENQDHLFFKRFQSYLLALPAAKEGVHVSFFRKSANNILKSKKVQKLFHILKFYCNYSNYEIIFVVVKKFCAAPLRQRVLEYKGSHIEFEKNTTVDIYLCAISAPPESDIFVGFTKMVTKINKPSNICTLYAIRQLKESIARNASLHYYSMYIEAPQEGSVHVLLRFPEECGWLVAGVMTAEFMETHQLTDVTFDGEDLKSYLAGQSAIIDAVWTEVVYQLLVASIDLQNEDGLSPLMLAVIDGHTEVVTQLLEAGANIDLQSNKDGCSALMLAAMEGNTEVVTQLLEAGANIDLPSTEDGLSALMFAAIEGHTEVATQLLEAGAKTDLQSTEVGWSALMYAAGYCNTEVVIQLLEAGATIDLQSTEAGVSALIVAASEGHTEVVIQILDAGANTDLQSTKVGLSALMNAAGEGHTEVVKQLLEAGANTDLQSTEDGVSPLMLSAMEGHTEVVAQLLEAGANVDLQDQDGNTAAIHATLCHHPDSLRQLVRAGADLNLCNKEGLTALTISSMNGTRDITDILLYTRYINSDLWTSNDWSDLFFSAEDGDLLY